MLVRKNNKKGMTMVEVLVALAIMSILIFIVYSVYISNLKFIDKENIKTDLQNEAQVIDSSFSQLSMQSTGVCKEYLNVNNKKVSTIMFNYPDEDNDKKYIKWIAEDNILKLQHLYKDDYGEYKQKSIHTLSENIDEFTIEPIGTTDLTKARVIKVKINLKKQKGFNTVEYPMEILVTFRNEEKINQNEDEEN